MSIQAITFDLDDTLWDIWPIIERAEARLHEWLAQHYPQLADHYTPLQIRELANQLGEQQPQWAHDRTYLRKRALSLAAEQVGYETFDTERAFAVFHVARNQVEFFDEALPTLERLASRYTLGALSNGNADIRLTGLDRYLSFAFNAIDVGRAKPEPQMFLAALAHLGLTPAQVAHVGDHPEHDVHGAQQLGIRSVWLNRAGRQCWPTQYPAPDAEIWRLDELEGVLGRW